MKEKNKKEMIEKKKFNMKKIPETNNLKMNLGKKEKIKKKKKNLIKY